MVTNVTLFKKRNDGLDMLLITEFLHFNTID